MEGREGLGKHSVEDMTKVSTVCADGIERLFKAVQHERARFDDAVARAEKLDADLQAERQQNSITKLEVSDKLREVRRRRRGARATGAGPDAQRRRSFGGSCSTRKRCRARSPRRRRSR